MHTATLLFLYLSISNSCSLAAFSLKSARTELRAANGMRALGSGPGTIPTWVEPCI